MKFDIEPNPHERVSYTFNTRMSDERIDKSMVNIVHEKVDKLLQVFTEE